MTAKKLMVVVATLGTVLLRACPAGALVAPPMTGVAGLEVEAPALMNAAYGGYTTAIYVENVSHAVAPAHVTITYYDQSGSVVGSGDMSAAQGIPLWGEWTVRQDNGHSFSPGGAGWGRIISDQEIAVFVNEFAPGSSDGSSYAGMQAATGVGTHLYAAAIANDAYGGYTTGIAVANLGTTSAPIAVDYHDQFGSLVRQQRLTLPPLGYVGLYSGDPALGLPDGFTGSAIVASLGTLTTPGPPIAAVVNETGPNKQFSSYDADGFLAGTLYIPAAMHDAYGGYTTGIAIANGLSTPATTTITYYTPSGAVAGSVVKSIPGNGYVGVYQGGADGPPASVTGYTAVISSPGFLVAIVNEVAPGGTKSTSFNAEHAGSGYLNFALVENAGSDGWSTGVAIMNVTSSTENLSFTYFDAATGMAINVTSLTLPAHGYLARYTPNDLPSGRRATLLFQNQDLALAGIANEAGTGTLMSYNGQ